MQKKIPKRFKRAVEVKSDTRHTELYRWLKAHHPGLAELLTEAKPGWATLALAIDKEGVKGPQGQTISADAVRRIWTRLCRDLAAEERHRLAGGTTKKATTRPPKGWTPPVAANPDTKRIEPAPFAPTASKPSSVGGSAAARLGMLDQLFGDFDKRSGR